MDMVLALPEELLHEFLLYQREEWPEGADLRPAAEAQLQRLASASTKKVIKQNRKLSLSAVAIALLSLAVAIASFVLSLLR